MIKEIDEWGDFHYKNGYHDDVCTQYDEETNTHTIFVLGQPLYESTVRDLLNALQDLLNTKDIKFK